jgi:hypothetical protein
VSPTSKNVFPLSIIPCKPPPSIHLAEAPRLDSTPGAGYLTHIAAVGAVSWVRSPVGATRTAVKGCPSRLLVAILPWIVAAAVSEQNRLLSSPRSRRKKPFSIWWSMERVLALLVIGHGATPEPCFIGTEERRRKSCGRSYLDECWRLDHRKTVHWV